MTRNQENDLILKSLANYGAEEWWSSDMVYRGVRQLLDLERGELDVISQATVARRLSRLAQGGRCRRQHSSWGGCWAYKALNSP